MYFSILGRWEPSRASQARTRLSALSAHIYLPGMSRLERIAWKFVHLVPRESELVSPATTPSTSSLRTQGTHNHRRMLFERVGATGVEKQHEPVVMGPRVRGDDGESCASAKLILPVVPTCRIPSGLPKHPNQWLPFLVSHSPEGRFAIVTNVGRGMRWTQSIEARSSRGRAISLRTAKSYGPGAPTLASSPQRRVPRLAGDGGKKARSPGRLRISRKTIAQGRPVDPPVPVVLPRAFFLHADHGCMRAPGLPCALSIR